MLNSKALKLTVRLGSVFNRTLCAAHNVDHKCSQRDSRTWKTDYEALLNNHKIITSEKGVSI
jgi:hypothetical protein